MKTNKLFSTILVSSTLVIAGCTNGSVVEPQGILITSVDNVSTLFVGDTLALTAVVLPEGASQDVAWTSTNVEIATVDVQGVVTALAPGNVNITATAASNEQITQNFALIVKEKPATVVLPEAITVSAEGNASSIKVGESLQLSALATPEGASSDVAWTTSDETIATISPNGKVLAVAEGTVTFTATSKAAENVSASYVLIVEASESGVTTTVDWSKISYTTHKDFIDMEYKKDTPSPVKVKGQVTYVTPVADGKANYYIQNGTEGYYIYSQDIVALPVEVGKCYEIGGFKKVYQGAQEIVDVELCSELSESIAYSVNDISTVKTDDLTEMNTYHGSLVKVAGASVTSLPTSFTKAFTLKASTSEKHAVDFRVDPKNMSDSEFQAIANKVSLLVVGSAIDVTGFGTAFGYGKASPQITVVRNDDIVVSELSPAAAVASVKGTLTLPNSVTADQNSIELPTTAAIDGVTISWASDNAAISATGAVTHPEKTIDVKLTATISYESASDTKDIYVTVFGTNNNYTKVLELNLEDSSTQLSYGCSATKPSYAEGKVTLGEPSAEWNLRNALIASSKDDRSNGDFSIRAQANANQDQSGRIELCQDFEFDVLEFKAGVYGGNALGITLFVSYSNDGGETWVTLPREYVINSTDLETISVAIPLEGAGRIAIEVVAGSGQRVNVDDICLYTQGA